MPSIAAGWCWSATATGTACANATWRWPGGENKRGVCSAVAPFRYRVVLRAYFTFVISDRSALSATMKAAPHQLVPSPLGLIVVMLPGLKLAVWALVITLHSAFDRSLS